MFMLSWYLRGLFESDKHQRTKFSDLDPTNVADEILLDIIADLTGQSELEVVNEARREVQKTYPGFVWNFDEYFKDMKLRLHPLIRNELRRAFYLLQK